MSTREKMKMFALGVAAAVTVQRLYSWSQTENEESSTEQSTERPISPPVSEQKNHEGIDTMEIDDTGLNSEIQIAVVPYGGYGVPRMSNFTVVSCDVPELKDGEVLVKSLFISVDPYLRGRMKALRVGNVPVSGTVAEVVESNVENISKGDKIFQYLPWRKLNSVRPDAPGFRKVGSDIPPSTAIGVAGMPGFTAYSGLLYVAKLKETDKTVFVSGAAGAVGTVVGQIAKLKGCRVVGTCGSAEKCDYLTKELGFDVALNYKEHGTSVAMRSALKKACPDGIDVYFDNTGGHTTEAVFDFLNKYARVAVCGQIAYYNAKTQPMTEAFLGKTIYKCITIGGFVVSEYADKQDDFIRDMTEWIKKGDVKYRETVVEGFNNVPRAFIGLFSGANIGKMVVKV